MVFNRIYAAGEHSFSDNLQPKLVLALAQSNFAHKRVIRIFALS